jgi:hypothetical protein
MADSSGMRAGLKGNVEEALRLFASEPEWAGLNLAETEFVLEETLKCYGATFDGEMIRELFKFYRRYLGMASVSRRQQLLTRITTFISEGHQHRSIALLCFISADTDGQITSGAALDLAMVTPPDKGDPLTGPKFVAFHGCGGVRAKLGKPGSDDEGDVAAGLLLLGDMRLLPLLEEIWARLTPEGRRRMVRRRSNLVSALMIEFLLRRLEADKEEEYFGELGAALHNLPAIAAKQPINAVLDIRRNFGLPSGKEPMELLSHEDIPTAFARFRPRLQALIDRESGPIKVLNATFSVWAEAAGWSPESEADDADEVEEEDELDDEDEYPDVCSEELHAEFEAMSDGDGFADISEDIYFWENPYKTKELSADEVEHEFTATPVFPLLVTGIFNPFGPTLNVYLVQKDNLDEWTFALLRLNPFSCTKADLGKLDPQRVRLEPGVLDQSHGAQRMSLAMKGRVNGGLDGAHDYILRIVLGRSRLQGSFTLCHSTTAVSPQKTKERVALAYLGAKNGRDDLNDLRDKQKRTDPWARADMAEAMRRIHEPQAAPAPLTPAEATELAGLVLSPAQQRIEMLNFLQAWEGSVEHAGIAPVLTREQLLQCLLYLTPDMPNLVNLRGDFHVAGAAQAGPAAGLAPAKAVERAKHKDAPFEEERTMTPAEKIAAAMDAPPVPKDETTYPKFPGLLAVLAVFSMVEVMLGVIVIVWALICTEWILSLVLTLFMFLQSMTFALIWARKVWVRWFAVINYGWLLAYLAYRIDRHQHVLAMTGAGFLLVQVMTIWAGVMGLIYLSYFRFAKTMREAPEVND